MAGFVEEFLHFEEVGAANQGVGVLLTVDGSLLQAGEDFRESHRDRLGAESLPGVDKQRHVGNADFEAVQIGRGLDRTVRGQVARAALKIADRAQFDLVEDLGFDFFADFAAGDFMQLSRIFQQIRGRHQNGLAGAEGREGFAEDADVGGAILNAGDQVFFLAKLFVGVDPDFETAVGILFDDFLELERAEVPGVLFVREVAKLQGDFLRCLGGSGCCGLFVATAATGGQQECEAEGGYADEFERLFHSVTILSCLVLGLALSILSGNSI